MASELGSKKALDRIDSALKITKKIRENYKVYMDYYRGNQHKLALGSELDPIVVNYTFNTIRTMVPTLYFKNPRIYAHATRAEYADRVPLVNAITNYDLRILNVKYQVKRTILRSLIGGFAWIENSYAFNEAGPAEDEEQITAESLVRAPESESTQGKEKKYTDPRIVKDSPIIISRSIMEVALDPWANQMDEIGWYAIKEIVPLKKVKKDPRYEATKNLKANVIYDSVIVNTFSDEFRKKGEVDFVELWHETDRWTGKTKTWARGHDSTLRSFDTPVGFDLVPMVFNEDPESNEHISIISVFKDQQDEINRFRQYGVEHGRRSLPKYVYDTDKNITEETLNRLTQADSHETIGIPGGAASIQPMNVAPLSADIYRIQNDILGDMRVASGLSDFQRGIPVKTPSATEAQILEQSSRLRVDEGVDIVAEAVERVMKNAFQLRQKYTTGENVVPIIGENNAVVWDQLASYTREQIQGDFEFTVDYASTQKKDQDFEKNQWLQLAPILQNLVAQSMQLPQMAVIGRALMQAYERPQNEIDALFPEQQPQQQVPQGLAGGGGRPPGIDQIAALLGGGRVG